MGGEAIDGSFQRRQVNPAVRHNGGGDDLAGDGAFPVLLPAVEIEAGQVVLLIAPAVGIGHVDPPGCDGRHAHQRVAKPLLPHRPAVQRQHFQLAALRVEDDMAVLNDRGRGAVIVRAVLPYLRAGFEIKGIELVAAEAATEEESPIGDGRRCKGTIAGHFRFPKKFHN